MGFLAGLFGGGKAKATAPTIASGLQLQSSVQGLPIPLVYGATRLAPNLIWYGDFQAIAQQSASGSGGGKGGVGGGGGGKGGGGTTSYTYATSFAMALCEGPITGIGQVYVDKNVTTLSELGLTLFTGSYSQSPWGYLTTNFPGQDLNYRGIAYLGAISYPLGNSPQLPNHNFEVFGLLYGTAPNGIDADPSQVVDDLVSNPVYGAGLPSSRVGDLSVYQAYCLANGLWVSPAYNMQTQTSALLDDLVMATNSAVLWANGVLTVIPYGDQSITANGYTYTAPAAPIYSLGDDDFMKNSNSSSGSSSSDPVQLNRKRPADNLNNVKLEVLDRSKMYNPAVVEAKDQALIDLYGLRATSSKQTHVFCDLNAGQLSATLQLQRQAVSNTYTITLDQRYILLDPMDIIALTDSILGLSSQWTRINEITENDDDSLTFVVEEYLAGNASAPTYSFQVNNGYNADYNSSPGNVNTPVIFELPVQVSFTGGLEVDLAVSGGANWGGCDVYISSDDATYKNVGRINGRARTGVVSAPLATGFDPDLVNPLSLNLAESFGQLMSGTQADADNDNTLLYVGGEYISYETATLTSAYNYTLTYLRRGQQGSAIATHAVGTRVARIDNGVLPVTYDKTQIGNTIYVKFASFNIYGGGLQDVSTLTPVSYVIQGPPLLGAVIGFQVTQNGNSVVFTWQDSIFDSGLKGYDIAYGLMGTTWEEKRVLTEAARGTEMTNADVPPGPWEFSIRVHDIADNLGAESKVLFTVSNPNALVLNSAQEPGWPGTVSGLVKHPSGVLVPDSLYPMDHYSDYTDFNNFVTDPVASGYYISQTFDVGYDSNLRVYHTEGSALGVGEIGAAATLQFAIDTWKTGEADPNSFTNWASGYVDFRFLRAKLTYSGISAGNVSMLTDFTVLSDVAPTASQSGQLTVAPGGSTLTFPNPYHTPPYVVPTAVSATGLYATVHTVTNIDCIIEIWNSLGVSVGGTANWTADGT